MFKTGSIEHNIQKSTDLRAVSSTDETPSTKDNATEKPMLITEASEGTHSDSMQVTASDRVNQIGQNSHLVSTGSVIMIFRKVSE